MDRALCGACYAPAMSERRDPAAILDVDGTLVDTNYLHIVAWYRAFRQFGVTLPMWRIHRHVGMGGDNFVPSIAGEDVDRDHGDDIRTAHDALYMADIEQTSVLPGARELLHELKGRGHACILATSARSEELEHYLKLLDAHDVADGWTTSADVEQTKPDPDVVHAALEKAGTDDAVVIGDSAWDCEAASRAGLRSIGLLSGGFSERELLDAGASQVFASTDELLARLEETAFAARAATA